jgi:hypothetical protein
MKALPGGPAELDTHHPVVSLFRRGSIRVVKGEDSVGYLNTRGGFPCFTGIARGYCKHCKTPGPVENFRDLIYQVFFGESQFCYVGYHFKQPEMNTFSQHIFYGSASKGAKAIAEKDGKPKLGGLAGILAIVAGAYGNGRMLVVLLLLTGAWWSLR